MTGYIPPHKRKLLQPQPSTKKLLEQLKTCSGKLKDYNIVLNDIKEFKCVSPSEWTKGKFIAKGNAGKVYQACCSNLDDEGAGNCKFVVKIIEHKNREGYDPISQDVVQKEILLQQAFNKHNLTTPIIEAFYCSSSDTSYIITKPKQSTLHQLCSYLAQIDKDNIMIVMLLQRAIDSIILANKHGLYHMDAHLSNFMTDIKTIDVMDDINQAVQTLQFIDFGQSVQSTPNDYELSENDLSLFLSSVMEMPFGSKVYPHLNFYQFQKHFDKFYRD